MSILETFYILFKTNSEEVEKGTKQAKSATDKLEDSLSKTDARTQMVGRSFLQMATRASAAIAGVISVGAILSSTFRAAEYANGLLDLSNALDISVEDLSMWGDAVAANGGTAEAFHGTLQGMATDFAQISTTGKSRLLPFFKELGISVTDAKGHVRGVLDVLPDLADSLSKVSKQQALGIGQKLGLDQGTIMLLQQGRREVDAVLERQKQLGVVTTKQAEIAKKYKDAQQDLAHVSRTLSMTLGATLLPALTWVYEKSLAIVDFLTDHKDAVVGFFLAVAGAVMGYAVPAFLTLALATIEIWGPIALVVGIVTALATAFALAYEDVMVFVRGGDSLIGRVLDWIKSFEGLMKVLRAVRDTAKDVWEWLGKANKDFNANAEMQITPSGRLVGNAQRQLGAAAAFPYNSVPGNAIGAGNRTSNRNTVVKIDQVNVQTQATDAKGMADAAATGLTTQMRQALSNSDDGIHA